MDIALYQPDIAPNVGSLVRLSACLGMGLHIIEPCGFPLDDKRMKRAAMDYVQAAELIRHTSFEAFLAAMNGRRLVLLTTKAADSFLDFSFRADDVLLLGRESGGVPQEVHERVDARILIPLNPSARSLNLVQAACIAAGEALRQTQLFPGQAG